LLEQKEKSAISSAKDTADEVTDIDSNISIAENEEDINLYFEKMQIEMMEKHRDGFCLVNMDSITPQEVSWLWYPYIPFGKITILQGDPGCGKTTFVLALATILANGTPFPTNSPTLVPTNVIYQTAEDGVADTIKPRLLSHNADCSRISFINDSGEALTLNDKRLEKAITKANAKLFVVDPLQAFLGPKVDMHRANEVRPVFSQLADVAERTGCAIVIIGHMNKSSSKGLYRSLGTIDIVAAARSVLLLGKDPDDPNVRAIIPIKSSLAPEGKAVSFSVGKNGFAWIGESELTAKQLLTERSSESESAVEIAKRLLVEKCSGEPFPSTELNELAEEYGISVSSIKRAKQLLGAKPTKKGDLWYVQLP
jgi:DNA repair protein RadA/Sms